MYRSKFLKISYSKIDSFWCAACNCKLCIAMRGGPHSQDPQQSLPSLPKLPWATLLSLHCPHPSSLNPANTDLLISSFLRTLKTLY